MMQVHFHPKFPQILISASLDGFVNVFDFTDGIDEDDAFKVGFSWHLLCRPVSPYLQGVPSWSNLSAIKAGLHHLTPAVWRRQA